MRLSTEAALAAILALAASEAALASNAKLVAWPNPGFSAAHTGFNKAEHAFTTSNVANTVDVWTFPTQGAIAVQPVAQDGTLYVLSNDNNLYALSESTGAELWTYPAGNYYGMGLAASKKLVYSTCVVQNNGSNVNGGLCALDAKTGKLAWSYAIFQDGGPVNSSDVTSPVLDGDTVVLGIADTSGYHNGFLAALDAKSGTLLWQIGDCGDTGDIACSNGASTYPPAIDNGGVFYGFGAETQGYNSALCRVDERTGAKTWCALLASGNPFDIAPTVSSGKVLFASSNGDDATATLYALDETTGATVWTATINGWNHAEAPAVANGLAYFAVGGNLYAVSIKTGKTVWSYLSGGPAGTLAGGVTVANGIVFGECGGAQFCAFNAKTGAVLASFGDRYAITDFTPTVVNGRVFETCDYNAICAYTP